MCLGVMVYDLLVKPVTADFLKKDTNRVDFIKLSSGEDAFNVSINLTRLGLSAVIIGKIGRDEFGNYLIKTAEECNVNINGVSYSEQGTSISIVLIQPNGERSFAYYGGATDQLKERDIDFRLIKNVRLLSIGSALALHGLDNGGLIRILKKTKSFGVKTVMDVIGDFDQDLDTLIAGFNKQVQQKS